MDRSATWLPRHATVIGVASIVGVVASIAGCSSGVASVEPAPAALAAHMDTLRQQALATANASSSQQVHGAYGIKGDISTDGLYAASFGVRPTEVSVNAVFASGPWHALSFELVNPPTLADSQYTSSSTAMSSRPRLT